MVCTITGHTGRVNCVRWLPRHTALHNHALLLTGSCDGTVRLWHIHVPHPAHTTATDGYWTPVTTLSVRVWAGPLEGGTPCYCTTNKHHTHHHSNLDAVSTPSLLSFRSPWICRPKWSLPPARQAIACTCGLPRVTPHWVNVHCSLNPVTGAILNAPLAMACSCAVHCPLFKGPPDGMLASPATKVNCRSDIRTYMACPKHTQVAAGLWGFRRCCSAAAACAGWHYNQRLHAARTHGVFPCGRVVKNACTVFLLVPMYVHKEVIEICTQRTSTPTPRIGSKPLPSPRVPPWSKGAPRCCWPLLGRTSMCGCGA